MHRAFPCYLRILATGDTDFEREIQCIMGTANGFSVASLCVHLHEISARVSATYLHGIECCVRREQSRRITSLLFVTITACIAFAVACAQAHVALEHMLQRKLVTIEVQRAAQDAAATAAAAVTATARGEYIDGDSLTLQKSSFLGWLFSGRVASAQTVSAHVRFHAHSCCACLTCARILHAARERLSCCIAGAWFRGLTISC